MKRKIAVIEIAEVLYRWNLGISKRQIAQTLGISRNTVKSLLKKAEAMGLAPGETASESLNEAAHHIIIARRKDSSRIGTNQARLTKWHNQLQTWREQPNMTITQMNRLLAEQGENISDTGLRRYIKKFFAADSKKVTIHLDTIPGQQAQVDYGYVGMLLDPVSKRLRKSYVFIMTLSHSRHRFVCFVFKQDVATWIDCHVKAFNFFGGVPATVLLDNLKAGVVKPHVYDPTINRSYAELERHYNFVIDPAKVRKPEHKGKVERSVTIVKQQVIAGREHQDINAANAYALQWCQHEIAQRIVRTTGETPWARFINEDKPALLPLPDTDFECATWQEGLVHKDHHVVVDGSFYSVPTKYIGQTVWIRFTLRTVQIYHDEILIKTHLRAHTKGQWLTDPKDYPEYVNEFLEKTPQACLSVAQAMGGAIYQLLSIILEKPSLTNQRKAQAILRLATKYDLVKVEAACQRSLFFGNYTYESIKRILEQKLTADIPVKAVITEGAYLRQASEFAIAEAA